MSEMMQDTGLLAIMVVGAMIILILWQSGLLDLLLIWLLIFVGILFAYRALKIIEPNEMG
ncbi:hypothetical protein E3J51_02785 [Candidatus Bathyarchaeota archaeon]|nr:MAG: hypothetical protein E3J51_02785 [Candidatus Bathyarchaeota archaeon]